MNKRDMTETVNVFPANQLKCWVDTKLNLTEQHALSCNYVTVISRVSWEHCVLYLTWWVGKIQTEFN